MQRARLCCGSAPRSACAAPACPSSSQAGLASVAAGHARHGPNALASTHLHGSCRHQRMHQQRQRQEDWGKHESDAPGACAGWGVGAAVHRNQFMGKWLVPRGVDAGRLGRTPGGTLGVTTAWSTACSTACRCPQQRSMALRPPRGRPGRLEAGRCGAGCRAGMLHSNAAGPPAGAGGAARPSQRGTPSEKSQTSRSLLNRPWLGTLCSGAGRAGGWAGSRAREAAASSSNRR